LVTASGGKVAANALKSTSGLWNNIGNGTDDFGFSALPGGYRYSGKSFMDVGRLGYWWTATMNNGYAYYRYMQLNDKDVNEREQNMDLGMSVRCIAD